MSWVEEQLKKRNDQDREDLSEALEDLSSVISGHSAFTETTAGRRKDTTDALGRICRYFRVKAGEIPSSVTELGEQIDYLTRPSGIMRRRVKLTGAWWKDSMGPMLCETKQGNAVALIPNRAGTYIFFSYEQKKEMKLSPNTAAQFKSEALLFYRPLPQRELAAKDILRFMWTDISISDIVFLVASALGVALLGLVLPIANQFVFSNVIETNQSLLLVSVVVMLCGLAISTFLITILKGLFTSRLQTKMSTTLQSAVMGRLINLPAGFFKEYSSGGLAQRVEVLEQLCVIICEGIISFGLTTIFSFVYVVQIFTIAPGIGLPAFFVLLAEILLVVIGIYVRIRCIRAELKAKNDVNSLVYAIYSGIQKIKLSGSENRIFAKWAEKYRKQAAAMYNQPFFLKVQNMIIPVVAILGNVLIYYFAATSKVPIADFMGFSASFSIVSGAILALSGVSAAFAYIGPILEMLSPILKAFPEETSKKKMIRKLQGRIELDNVAFQYSPDGPKILDGINLTIKPGEYVAIVGKSGCGKSTLLRLLLGFETPQTGSVYYDGIDIEKIDLHSLRQNIGVVMQNSSLFAGDIYSNITISAPWLSLEEAWRAAEMAGVSGDIRGMPMQMHTMISEGGGGVSGGQRQRLMIARAIAPNPRVLMFDEATSALDNITQQEVSDSLGQLKSTRIVIAHRLSTIIKCDRIIVLDSGCIQEMGAYQELIQKNGVFAELVKRQQL